MNSSASRLFHIAGTGSTLNGLLLGIPTVLYPLGAFDPDELLDVLANERVTGLFLVPAQWQAVIAAQRGKPRDIRLRMLSWGAAPASDSLLREMAETFPVPRSWRRSDRPKCRLSLACFVGDDAIRKMGSVGSRCQPSMHAWSTTT